MRRFGLPIVIAGAMTGGCGLILGIDDIDGPGPRVDATTPEVTSPKDAGGADTNVADTAVPDTGFDAGFDLTGVWVGKWRQNNGPLSQGGDAKLTIIQKGYVLSGSGNLDNSTCFVAAGLEGQVQGMPRPPEPVALYGVLTSGSYSVTLKANWDGDAVISGTFDTSNMAGPCSNATGTFDGKRQ